MRKLYYFALIPFLIMGCSHKEIIIIEEEPKVEEAVNKVNVVVPQKSVIYTVQDSLNVYQIDTVNYKAPIRSTQTATLNYINVEPKKPIETTTTVIMIDEDEVNIIKGK